MRLSLTAGGKPYGTETNLQIPRGADAQGVHEPRQDVDGCLDRRSLVHGVEPDAADDPITQYLAELVEALGTGRCSGEEDEGDGGRYGGEDERRRLGVLKKC